MMAARCDPQADRFQPLALLLLQKHAPHRKVRRGAAQVLPHGQEPLRRGPQLLDLPDIKVGNVEGDALERTIPSTMVSRSG